MEDLRFAEIAEKMRDMLTAVVMHANGGIQMPGEPRFYNAFFNGTEVVVLGYSYDGGDGHTYTKPICIAVDEEVMDRLRVDGESGRVRNGEVQPPHVV